MWLSVSVLKLLALSIGAWRGSNCCVLGDLSMGLCNGVKHLRQSTQLILTKGSTGTRFSCLECHHLLASESRCLDVLALAYRIYDRLFVLLRANWGCCVYSIPVIV